MKNDMRARTGGAPGPPDIVDELTENASRLLLKAIGRMAPEEALFLKYDLGLLIPMRLVYQGAPTRYAYRCRQCKGPAFFFLGEQFVYVKPDRSIHASDSPPLGVPLEDLPWYQLDDSRPAAKSVLGLCCAHCCAAVLLNPDRSLRAQQIIRLPNQEVSHGSQTQGDPRRGSQGDSRSRRRRGTQELKPETQSGSPAGVALDRSALGAVPQADPADTGTGAES